MSSSKSKEEDKKTGILANRKNAAKLFFLLLSIFLWFLINLSKDGYSTYVHYPVLYEEEPLGYRLINDPPQRFKILVKGSGYDILKIKLRQFKPVQIPLKEIEMSSQMKAVYQTNQTRSLITKELGEKLDIAEIEPSVLNLEFSPIEEKRFKVYLDWKADFSKFKTFYHPPKITPDSITIWGTQQELSSIDSIKTETISLDAESDSISLKARIELPQNEGLKLSDKVVNVEVKLTSLTEGTFEIPISVRHLPANYEFSLIPHKARLTYRVAIEDFAKVEADDFEIYVDFREINSGSEFLSIKSAKQPDLVRSISLQPTKVEYILKQ